MKIRIREEKTTCEIQFSMKCFLKQTMIPPWHKQVYGNLNAVFW